MHLLLQIGVGGDLAKLPNMRIAISTASLQEAGHSCHCRIEKEQSLIPDSTNVSDISSDVLLSLLESGHRHAVLLAFMLANILAQPLIGLAPHLASRTRPGGDLVLSGILSNQAREVMAAYEPWFVMDEPEQREEWIRLTGRRHDR